MSDDRYAIRHYGKNLWDIIDREGDPHTALSGEHMARMTLEEGERVVRLMNEMDRHHRARSGPIR